jgi:hypothetical protein
MYKRSAGEWLSLYCVPESGTFHAMWNSNFSGTDHLSERALHFQLLTQLEEEIRARLPPTWRVVLSREVRRDRQQLDGLLSIAGPDGTQAQAVIEVKRFLEPKEASFVVDKLRKKALPGEALLVMAQYIGQGTRTLLREAEVNYADATGRLRLALESPAVYIERPGASENPWAETRSLRSLKGPAAGRVVRALCDFRPPFGIRALAERSQTPVSSVSRVVDLLDREALLTRDERGKVLEVRWQELIQRWTQDYALTTSNTVHTCLEPRGLEALLRKLGEATFPYAVTGSLAATRVAPLASPRLAAIFVMNSDLATNQLALRKAESGANVLLIQPFDAVVFERAIRSERVTYAAFSQVAADLLTGPGRGPEEGEALLQWMKEHEDAWRL